jgi:hypothetical protein
LPAATAWTGVIAGVVDREAVVLVVDERSPQSRAVRLPPLSGIEKEIVSLDVQVVTEDSYLFGRIEYDVRHVIYPFRRFVQKKVPGWDFR